MLHLARALYDAYRTGLADQGVELQETWTDITEDERAAWEAVAQKAIELV